MVLTVPLLSQQAPEVGVILSRAQSAVEVEGVGEATGLLPDLSQAPRVVAPLAIVSERAGIVLLPKASHQEIPRQFKVERKVPQQARWPKQTVADRLLKMPEV
jgi:hypothetical protein